MAREIVTWCDVELARGDHAPGEPVVANLNGGKAMTIDLCDTCRKEVVAPLAELLREHGRPLDARPRPILTPGGGILTDPTPADPPPVATPSKTPSRRHKTKTTFDCPVVGCTGRGTYPNLLSFKAHIRHQHVLTWGDFMAQYGDPTGGTAPAYPARGRPRKVRD